MEDTKKTPSIIDKVKTFEDAFALSRDDNKAVLSALNASSTYFKTYPELPGLFRSAIAYVKLCIITEVLNEGWKLDWRKEDEYKWYPFFDMGRNGDFEYASRGSSRFTCVDGPFLCFKSKELAEYAGKQFIQLYKEMMLQ